MARPEHLTLLHPRAYTALQASLDAFLLSKQAARCTPKTLVHYRYTVGSFTEGSFGHAFSEGERERVMSMPKRRVSCLHCGLISSVSSAVARQTPALFCTKRNTVRLCR